MATATAAPQTNGVPASSAGSSSQTIGGTQTTAVASPQPANGSSQSQTQTQTQTQAQSQPAPAPTPTPAPQPAPQPPAQAAAQAASPPTTTAPRPRDARTIELLLTAQGVTAYEARVPLLLLDFAYRHTSAVLSDAIHLSADPYTTHAGARPSAASGAAATAPGTGGDAAVGPNAVQLAIGARLAYQFRGGGGAAAGGGGASKEWMLELARDRNRIALPRVAPSEWGVRLPSERFVMSGVGWGLRDVWTGSGAAEADEEDGDGDGDEPMGLPLAGGDAMEGIEAGPAEDEGGDPVEGGTIEDMFGDEMDEDMEGDEA